MGQMGNQMNQMGGQMGQMGNINQLSGPGQMVPGQMGQIGTMGSGQGGQAMFGGQQYGGMNQGYGGAGYGNQQMMQGQQGGAMAQQMAQMVPGMNQVSQPLFSFCFFTSSKVFEKQSSSNSQFGYSLIILCFFIFHLR